MMKQYKWTFLITSILTLLPSLFGIVMWNRLGEEMAIHWGFSGTPDGYAGRLVVILLPVFLLALQWLGILLTVRDNRKNPQSGKVLTMAFWIVPIFSLYVNGFIYATALGFKLNISVLIALLLGLALIVIGNYMPKATRNRTVGIKIRTALANDENWNATHRFTGKLWVACGAIFLFTAFLPMSFFPITALILLLTIIIPPIVYSTVYYKKQLARGTATKDELTSVKKQFPLWATAVLLTVMLVVFLIILFTGNVHTTCNESALSIEATYYSDLTVQYKDIEAIEYRDGKIPGERVMGFGTPRLLMGTFRNEEFGTHTRYTYAECDACIVLTVNGKTLLLNAQTPEETKALYKTLCGKLQ